MSTENHQNQDRMRLFTPDRSEGLDRLIEETEQQIANTRLFLERLNHSEERTRRYVDELKASFENDLRRFQRDRRENEAK